MTDKKKPKIRVVSLSGKSPTENSGSRAADCKCESDTCPECRVQHIECDCHPQCTCVSVPPCHCEDAPSCGCHPHTCKCDSDSHPKNELDEKKQQQSKKEKVKPRTVFKIGKKKK